MSLSVEVTVVHQFGLYDTLITFTGTDVDSGDLVRFGVDHRPARDIREALRQGELPMVEVEEWAILSRAGQST